MNSVLMNHSVLTNHPGLTNQFLTSKIFLPHKSFGFSEFPGLTNNWLGPNRFVKSGRHCKWGSVTFKNLNTVKALGMEDHTRSWNSMIGPVIRDKAYFVTRHPLSVKSGIKPFSSLNAKIWTNYFFLYIILTLASIYIHMELTRNMSLSNFLQLVLNPSEVLWQSLFRGCLLMQCMGSFAFWTFDILYGVDLWSALVAQTFEPEVNDWNDIQWFNAEFIFVPNLALYRAKSVSENLLHKNLIDFHMLNFTQRGRRDRPFKSVGYENVPNFMNYALMKDKSYGLTMIMSKNAYVLSGEMIVRMGQEFKLRISNRSVYSFAHGYESKQFWTLSKHSLLTEPLSQALQKVWVMLKIQDYPYK